MNASACIRCWHCFADDVRKFERRRDRFSLTLHNDCLCNAPRVSLLSPTKNDIGKRGLFPFVDDSERGDQRPIGIFPECHEERLIPHKGESPTRFKLIRTPPEVKECFINCFDATLLQFLTEIPKITVDEHSASDRVR